MNMRQLLRCFAVLAVLHTFGCKQPSKVADGGAKTPASTSCSAQTQSSCTGNCTWNGYSCVDNSGSGSYSNSACSSFYSSTTCPSSRCTWNGSSCAESGYGNQTAIQCSSYSYQSQLNCPSSSCTWNGSACVDINNSTGSQCSGYTQANCTSYNGCQWNGSYCTSLSNTTTNCSSYYQQSQCPTYAGCQWTGSSCINSNLGNATNCSSYYQQSQCPTYSGCQWVNNMCVSTLGNGANCIGLNIASCMLQSGCTYSVFQGCYRKP